MNLGRYTVLAELGHGGSAVVYRARSPEGRDVAVKVLKTPTSQEAFARFERERRLFASLGEREGFVPLLDAGRDGENPFLVFALIPGGTLRSRLEKGPLPIETVLALGRAVAAALGAAHAKGIVHRDVKPENILFTDPGDRPSSWGRALVGDLGVAKHFRRDLPGGSVSANLSQTGALHGTIAYMAPEQAFGSRARHEGPPIDVFALGAVLYECLTGTIPFDAPTAYETLLRIESGHFTPPRALRPDVPPELERVIERALAHAPEDRFADGAALARALAPEAKPAPSRLRLVLGGAALLVAGALGAGVIASLSGASLSGTPRAATPPPGPKPPPPRPGPSSRDAVLEEAERILAGHFDKETVKRLAPLADEACARSPGSGAACALRAWVRLRDGALDAALADAERALALDARCARGYFVRGVVRLEGGDVAGAGHDLEEALRLEPRRPEYIQWRGMLRTRTGDLAGAAADAALAIELDPRDGHAFALRAGVRLLERDWAGVVADTTRAIELEGAAIGAPPLCDRAEAHRMLREFDAAIADLDEALRLEPEHAPTWADRGALHFTRRELDAAEADLAHALALEPRLQAAWSKRSVVKLFAEDADGAVACATKALDLDPKDRYALATRAQARVQLGDFESAERDAESLLALDPRWAAGLVVRGRVLLHRGDAAAALEVLDQALALDRSAFAYVARGLAHATLGHEKAALADLDAAQDAPGPRREALRERGLLRARLGRPDAREDLEASLRLLGPRQDDPEVLAALEKLPKAPQGDAPPGR